MVMSVDGDEFASSVFAPSLCCCRQNERVSQSSPVLDKSLQVLCETFEKLLRDEDLDVAEVEDEHILEGTHG